MDDFHFELKWFQSPNLVENDLNSRLYQNSNILSIWRNMHRFMDILYKLQSEILYVSSVINQFWLLLGHNPLPGSKLTKITVPQRVKFQSSRTVCECSHVSEVLAPRHVLFQSTVPLLRYNFIFSCDQAALQMVFSVRLSVRLSVCPSVCHTFFTMFPSSYHHEIFRSYYHGQKWCPCKRSRSEVKGQGHRGQHPTSPFPDSNSSVNSHMTMKWCI